MLVEESQEKNIQFIKSLRKKHIKKQTSLKDMQDNINDENEENLDHLLRRSVYNQDLVLYSRVMIDKKKLYNNQINQLSPVEQSDLYKEFKNFNASYEARKNFYLKKNKLLEKVDENFHSSLLEKKGTFYNNFKNYTSKNPKEIEVVIGSKDMLSQDPDLFKYEKLDEDFPQKIYFENQKPKKSEISNLNGFKEAHAHFRNKSLDRFGFISPFQFNLAEKFNRKRDLLNKIDEYKHKNLNLDELIKTENLTKKFKEENNFDLNPERNFTGKASKVSSLNTANSTRSNLNTDKKEETSGYDKKSNDKSLNYLIFDRNKSSLSANVDSISNKILVSYNNQSVNNNGNKRINKGNLLLKENLSKNNSKEKERRNSFDKEQLLKCVMEKLPIQKINLNTKIVKDKILEENNESAEKIKVYIKQMQLKSSKEIYEGNNKEKTISPVSRQNDSFNLNNIINNDQEHKEKLQEKIKNPSIFPKNHKKINNKRNNILNNNNKNVIKIYLPNPFNLQNRKYDNDDLDLDRERRNNKQLSHNQKIPLLEDEVANSRRSERKFKEDKKLNTNAEKSKEKHSDRYESYFEKTHKHNNSHAYNQYIKIENNNSIFNHDNNKQNEKSLKKSKTDNRENRNKFDTKENLKINAFINKELANEKNKLNRSSNISPANDDRNSHILGALYNENKNKAKAKSNLILIIKNDQTNLSNDNNNFKADLPLMSNRSWNTIKDIDINSYNFSHQSCFDLENNIIDVKSKYDHLELNKNHNEINAGKNFSMRKNLEKVNTNNNYNHVGYINKANKIDYSEIKNEKINQTLNENVFKEVKKKIINLNCQIKEDLFNEKNVSIKSNYDSQNNKNPYIKYTKNKNESQTQKNFIGKKLNNINRSVLRPFSLILNNISNNEQNTSCISNTNSIHSSLNNKNIDNFYEPNNNKGKLFITNYNKDFELQLNKSNQGNTFTNNSNIVIYTNSKANKPKLNESKQGFNLIQPQEKRDLSLNDTANNLPSAQNTSNSKVLKSKSKIFTHRESLFENPKIKKAFGGEASKKPLASNSSMKNANIISKYNTKNAIDIPKNKVVLEFKYPLGSCQNQIKNENFSISNNIVKNYSNNSNLNNYNNSNKKIINRSSTTQEPNCDIIDERNIYVENSRVSNHSSGKSRNNSGNSKISRSNSLRNNLSPLENKDKNESLNINIKEIPQYFLNRNIMEEYEKIKSHTRKFSENQIIYSELKYKLDIMHENKGNFTNLLNEDIIKGNVVDSNLILPKI